MRYKNIEEKYKSTIEKYNLLDGINKIVYLFSGGKDATFGLHLLDEYVRNNNLDITITAPVVMYPKHVYLKNSELSEKTEKVLTFWKNRNVDLLVLDSERDDLSDDKDGCGTCKKARMELITDVLKKFDPFGVAVVTGYTMYDILAYLEQFAIVTNYSFDLGAISDNKLRRSILNFLHKMKIKEILPSGFTIIRPLLTFHEDIILEYLKKNEIPYVNTPCKISDYKHKRLYFKSLQVIEKHNQCSYEGVLEFLKKNNVKLPDDNEAITIETETQFTDC